jgi:hypothetical protein
MDGGADRTTLAAKQQFCTSMAARMSSVRALSNRPYEHLVQALRLRVRKGRDFRVAFSLHNGEVAHTLILGMTGSGKSFLRKYELPILLPKQMIILAGELTKSASLPKHSFVDSCSLIERARLSLIGPGAIIRGVFRHPHAEDSFLPFSLARQNPCGLVSFSVLSVVRYRLDSRARP